MTAVIIAAGGTVRTFSYDPFGNSTASGSGANHNQIGYTGALTDPSYGGTAATGWTHLGQRWQNPATGSFTSQDPSAYLADPANGNRYAYAADNPANYTDPTGHCFIGLFGSGCNNPVYNFFNRISNFINSSCVNVWSATIGGGVFGVASGYFGMVTSETVVGARIGWAGVGIGAVSLVQGYTALSNGACS